MCKLIKIFILIKTKIETIKLIQVFRLIDLNSNI